MQLSRAGKSYQRKFQSIRKFPSQVNLEVSAGGGEDEDVVSVQELREDPDGVGKAGLGAALRSRQIMPPCSKQNILYPSVYAALKQQNICPCQIMPP
jgi:hypothetical protein